MAMMIPDHALEPDVDDVLNGRLSALMIRKGVSKGQVAEAINVSPSGVTRRFRGQTEWTLQEMKAVARLLGTSVGFLLGETDVSTASENAETPAASATGVSGDAVRPKGFEPLTF